MALYTTKLPKRFHFTVLNLLACKRCKSELREIKEESRTCHARALNHFDDLYKTVYGNHWSSIRLALLSPAKKGIIVNNFSDTQRICEYLKHKGALNVHQLFIEQKNKIQAGETQECMMTFEFNPKLDEIIQKTQEEDIDSLYPEPTISSSIALEKLSSGFSDIAKKADGDDELEREQVPSDPTQDIALSENLKEANYDLSRLIVPNSSGIATSASLYEFTPATKLMGMDEYVPESAHYTSYRDAADFTIDVQQEDSLNFPPNLKIFAYDRGNCSTFPLPSKGSSDLLDYYEIDLALLAPILALDIQPEDRVLDMCSSLGDAAVLIAQTLAPKISVTNTAYASNASFILHKLSSYFPNILENDSNLIVTQTHPMAINDSLLYNKILLAVPNLNDRKSVNDDTDSYFHVLKAKARVSLPEVQKKLLRKALELVDEGGTVVYFTQSLSPVQNEGVVAAALQELWRDTQCRFVVKDLEESFQPLHQFLKIAKSDKCGHIVIPFLPNNYGPLYVCKIVKTFHDMDSVE